MWEEGEGREEEEGGEEMRERGGRREVGWGGRSRRVRV